MRCVHLNRTGEQCRDQALQDSHLCAYHARILEDRDLDHDEPLRRSPSRFPFFYRVAAAALLLIFALQAWQALRSWLDF